MAGGGLAFAFFRLDSLRGVLLALAYFGAWWLLCLGLFAALGFRLDIFPMLALGLLTSVRRAPRDAPAV